MNPTHTPQTYDVKTANTNTVYTTLYHRTKIISTDLMILNKHIFTLLYTFIRNSKEVLQSQAVSGMHMTHRSSTSSFLALSTVAKFRLPQKMFHCLGKMLGSNMAL